MPVPVHCFHSLNTWVVCFPEFRYFSSFCRTGRICPLGVSFLKDTQFILPFSMHPIWSLRRGGMSRGPTRLSNFSFVERSPVASSTLTFASSKVSWCSIGGVPPKSSAIHIHMARVEGLESLTRLFSLVSGPLFFFFLAVFPFFVAACLCVPSFVCIHLARRRRSPPPPLPALARSLDALWSTTLFTSFEHSILSFNPWMAVTRPTCPLLSEIHIPPSNTPHGLRLELNWSQAVIHRYLTSASRRDVPWLQRCLHSLPRPRESNPVVSSGSIMPSPAATTTTPPISRVFT